jgi:outer membrane protein assembly factor BamB
LFVPTGKKISCYTASGNLLWSRIFESDFSIAPHLDQAGGIHFALDNNEAWRIGPFGDFQKWNLAKRPEVLLSVVYQDAPQVLAVYQDGTMEFPGIGGEWFVSAQGGANSRPLPKLPSGPLAAVSRGSEIAAVLRDGKVIFVSFDQGNILWEGDSHIREIIKKGGRPEQEAEMLFDERGVYILSKDGACGFTRDGRRLWYTLLKNAAAVPAFGDDGVLYSGGQDWILYAYKLEDRVLGGRNNLYGPAPAGSYGTGSPLSSFMTYPLEYEIRPALNQIGTAVNAGREGNNELAWKSWLMTVADSEFAVHHRINALGLLGQIGSSETVPWLTGLFRRESEPLVKAAAANAIGVIGVDPGGDAIRAFFDAVTYAGGLQNERVLIAITSATGALCRFSGPPLSETGVKILVFLSGYTAAPVVRRQASRELAQLRG